MWSQNAVAGAVPMAGRIVLEKCCWRATEVLSSSSSGRRAGWLNRVSSAASMPWRVIGITNELSVALVSVGSRLCRKSSRNVAGAGMSGCVGG